MVDAQFGLAGPVIYGCFSGYRPFYQYSRHRVNSYRIEIKYGMAHFSLQPIVRRMAKPLAMDWDSFGIDFGLIALFHEP